MRSLFRHFFGKSVKADFFDSRYAGFPIGAENETEKFGKEIIKILTLHYIRIFLALGAGFIVILHAAFSDAAPFGFFIFGAARTFARAISLATSAIEPAKSHKIRIIFNWFHIFLLILSLILRQNRLFCKKTRKNGLIYKDIFLRA